MVADVLTEKGEIRIRYDALRRVGYLWGAALRLAQCTDVDVVEAGRLLDLGCPQETAVRILT